MSIVPEKLLRSLEGVEGFNRKGFVEIHEASEKVVSIRTNPAKPAALEFGDMERVPWSSNGYYLSHRPAFIFDPLIHAGAYYVQEASSMFIEQCVVQLADLERPLRVLDLCAAPGGKSTLLHSLISDDSLLVSNEVIRSRVHILSDNLVKWGRMNKIVTSNDPLDFARLKNYFDIIVVDAPCSGSGLFRRDPSAIAEWSEEAVEMCSQRQRRILSDVWPALRHGGLLVYSTCSYSKKEDEDICDWLSETVDIAPAALTIKDEWNIVKVESSRNKMPGYRFFPDRLPGEGFFVACFHKQGDDERSASQPNRSRLVKLTAKNRSVTAPWLETQTGYSFYFRGKEVFALPSVLDMELALISEHLYIRNAGTSMGRLIGDDLAPDHELALSIDLNKTINSVSLKKDEALQYLRKEEVTIDSELRGWALVKYEALNLGWVKLLHNRINNYYPKEWRILKSANH